MARGKDVEVGYEHIHTREFVPVDEAYGYALEQCLNGSDEEKHEFREMLVEWYFSGNWTMEEK